MGDQTLEFHGLRIEVDAEGPRGVLPLRFIKYPNVGENETKGPGVP